MGPIFNCMGNNKFKEYCKKCIRYPTNKKDELNDNWLKHENMISVNGKCRAFIER